MKDRIEFTSKISALLQQMVNEGERPVLDFVRQSRLAVRILFELGLTAYDGVNSISPYQLGLAAYIFFWDANGNRCDPVKGWDYWHTQWMAMGGKPEQSWHIYSFEG